MVRAGDSDPEKHDVPPKEVPQRGDSDTPGPPQPHVAGLDTNPKLPSPLYGPPGVESAN